MNERLSRHHVTYNKDGRCCYRLLLECLCSLNPLLVSIWNSHFLTKSLKFQFLLPAHPQEATSRLILPFLLSHNNNFRPLVNWNAGFQVAGKLNERFESLLLIYHIGWVRSITCRKNNWILMSFILARASYIV